MTKRTAMLLMVGQTFFLGNIIQAETFEPISTISASTEGSDLDPAVNLIQGAGIGFDATPPHNQIGGGQWVTSAPAGYPSDYIEEIGTPVLILDLGADTNLSEISVWGYSNTNANGVSEFSLLFATAADGPGGFGTSIPFNPTYSPINDDLVRQSFPFGQVVQARYVEFTATDNFFVPPGDGSGGGLPGGDRVGLGEIAFAVVPVPVELQNFVIE